MIDREKVIKGLKHCRGDDCNGDKWYKCEYSGHGCIDALLEDALALLKAQEEATIEPKRIDLEEETKAWLDKMDAVDALGNIADICIDWDGYRIADGLGGLINEIWAYARYCADRLLKAQEPVAPVPTLDDDWVCGNCGESVVGYTELESGGFEDVQHNFCPNCGRAVKWE